MLKTDPCNKSAQLLQSRSPWPGMYQKAGLKAYPRWSVCSILPPHPPPASLLPDSKLGGLVPLVLQSQIAGLLAGLQDFKPSLLLGLVCVCIFFFSFQLDRNRISLATHSHECRLALAAYREVGQGGGERNILQLQDIDKKGCKRGCWQFYFLALGRDPLTAVV